MGSRKQNFYNQLAQRMGYEKEAAEIQDKYLAGDKDGAAAAVPHELIDSTTLLGSVERIADRMQAYAAAGVTTLTLAPAGFTLERAGRRAARGRGGPGAGRARVAGRHGPREGPRAGVAHGAARVSAAVVGARGSSPPRPSRGNNAPGARAVTPPGRGRRPSFRPSRSRHCCCRVYRCRI